MWFFFQQESREDVGKSQYFDALETIEEDQEEEEEEEEENRKNLIKVGIWSS